MNQHEFCCERMRPAVASEDMPIVFEAKFREFGIRVFDGGTSYIELIYCPWSGDKLPGSLREQWFDELERRGIDPATDRVPAEFSDARWYTRIV